MRLRWGLLFVLTCASCRTATTPVVPGEPDLAPPPPPPPLTPSVKVVTNDPAKLGGPGETLIKMGSTRDLHVRLQLPDVPAGVFWVTLRLHTPTGAVYDERHTPYSADPNAPKRVDSPDGVPHPIDVFPAKAIPGGFGLDLPLLVGGTNLMRRPFPGLWRITVAVDNSASMAAETIIEMGLMP